MMTNEETGMAAGWELRDFATQGWDTLEICAGARIAISHGVGCGERFGRVVEQVQTRWGSHWTVAMDDGSTETLHGGYRGRALATPYGGSSSDPILCTELRGIGFYVVRVAPSTVGFARC